MGGVCVCSCELLLAKLKELRMNSVLPVVILLR